MDYVVYDCHIISRHKPQQNIIPYQVQFLFLDVSCPLELSLYLMIFQDSPQADSREIEEAEAESRQQIIEQQQEQEEQVELQEQGQMQRQVQVQENGHNEIAENGSVNAEEERPQIDEKELRRRKIARNRQVAKQEADDFLKQPVLKISNLSKDLKRAYEKGFLDDKKYDFIRTLRKKRRHPQQDSVSSHIASDQSWNINDALPKRGFMKKRDDILSSSNSGDEKPKRKRTVSKPRQPRKKPQQPRQPRKPRQRKPSPEPRPPRNIKAKDEQLKIKKQQEERRQRLFAPRTKPQPQPAPAPVTQVVEQKKLGATTKITKAPAGLLWNKNKNKQKQSEEQSQEQSFKSSSGDVSQEKVAAQLVNQKEKIPLTNGVINGVHKQKEVKKVQTIDVAKKIVPQVKPQEMPVIQKVQTVAAPEPLKDKQGINVDNKVQMKKTKTKKQKQSSGSRSSSSYNSSSESSSSDSSSYTSEDEPKNKKKKKHHKRHKYSSSDSSSQDKKKKKHHKKFKDMASESLITKVLKKQLGMDVKDASKKDLEVEVVHKKTEEVLPIVKQVSKEVQQTKPQATIIKAEEKMIDQKQDAKIVEEKKPQIVEKKEVKEVKEVKEIKEDKTTVEPVIEKKKLNFTKVPATIYKPPMPQKIRQSKPSEPIAIQTKPSVQQQADKNKRVVEKQKKQKKAEINELANELKSILKEPTPIKKPIEKPVQTIKKIQTKVEDSKRQKQLALSSKAVVLQVMVGDSQKPEKMPEKQPKKPIPKSEQPQQKKPVPIPQRKVRKIVAEQQDESSQQTYYKRSRNYRYPPRKVVRYRKVVCEPSASQDSDTSNQYIQKRVIRKIRRPIVQYSGSSSYSDIQSISEDSREYRQRQFRPRIVRRYVHRER